MDGFCENTDHQGQPGAPGRDEQKSSQSYITKEVSDDKALPTALALTRGTETNPAHTAYPRRRLPRSIDLPSPYNCRKLQIARPHLSPPSPGSNAAAAIRPPPMVAPVLPPCLEPTKLMIMSAILSMASVPHHTQP
jgi:hypothetical protein